jgi:cell division protein FtsQ
VGTLRSLAARALGACALTALCLYGAKSSRSWALTTPRFSLTSLSFVGLHRASEAELLRISGLLPGQNLWALDTLALVSAMSLHPWVQSVNITRRFPHAVVVRVEEHVPAAIAVLNDLYLVDEHGEPFQKVGAEGAFDLPLVTGLTREDYMERTAGATRKLVRALEVAKAYGESEAAVGERLSELHYEGEALTLVTGRGQAVALGEGPAGPQLLRLSRVREELHKRGVSASTIRLDNRARPGWVAVELEQPLATRFGSSK